MWLVLLALWIGQTEANQVISQTSLINNKYIIENDLNVQTHFVLNHREKIDEIKNLALFLNGSVQFNHTSNVTYFHNMPQSIIKNFCSPNNYLNDKHTTYADQIDITPHQILCYARNIFYNEDCIVHYKKWNIDISNLPYGRYTLENHNSILPKRHPAPLLSICVNQTGFSEISDTKEFLLFQDDFLNIKTIGDELLNLYENTIANLPIAPTNIFENIPITSFINDKPTIVKSNEFSQIIDLIKITDNFDLKIIKLIMMLHKLDNPSIESIIVNFLNALYDDLLYKGIIIAKPSLVANCFFQKLTIGSFYNYGMNLMGFIPQDPHLVVIFNTVQSHKLKLWLTLQVHNDHSSSNMDLISISSNKIQKRGVGDLIKNSIGLASTDQFSELTDLLNQDSSNIRQIVKHIKANDNDKVKIESTLKQFRKNFRVINDFQNKISYNLSKTINKNLAAPLQVLLNNLWRKNTFSHAFYQLIFGAIIELQSLNEGIHQYHIFYIIPIRSFPKTCNLMLTMK